MPGSVLVQGEASKWAWGRAIPPRLVVAGLALVLGLIMIGDVLAASVVNSRRVPAARSLGPASPVLVAVFGPDWAPAAASVPAGPSAPLAATPLPAMPAAPLSAASWSAAPVAAPPAARRPCTAPATVMVARHTVVAHLTGDTPTSAGPGGPAVGTVPGSWYGYPSILPVIGRAPGWLQVREPQRPNGSTAWIPAAAATLSSTPWYLLANLCTSRLLVFDAGRKVYDFPAGIGTPAQPTVTGDYFVTMTAPSPDPGYGPFVLATSAHSDAITDWEGTGDALIAIHGPITAADDGRIGTTGAAISHGCIRLHDADLAQLADVLPGSPLLIIGS